MKLAKNFFQKSTPFSKFLHIQPLTRSFSTAQIIGNNIDDVVRLKKHHMTEKRSVPIRYATGLGRTFMFNPQKNIADWKIEFFQQNPDVGTIK